MAVILETSIGDITVDLYTDERPRCSLNFLKLCKIKYYNWCLFHSVQRNLVAQSGDPTSTGRGGDSVFTKLYGEQARYFEMEIKPRIKHTKKGTLSMVNNGEGMHGSQFFLTTAPELDYLDGVHTVFGEVSEGMDVLDKLNETIVDEENRPYQDIRIYHTVVLDDPFDDPPGLGEHIPDRSPEPTKEQLDSGRIGVDEKINDEEGKTKEEVEQMLKVKEAKANAQLLEMVGDLPDVDAKPMDNVLFVCKLNPVTCAEDLEVIFSRFGNILSCEVIKDQKTGESLQYAFIEFEKKEECENAYFKMDNVLIDDRRIHVDFSQSVAKLKYQKGGKFLKNQEEERPQFVIKDRNRRNDNYEFVFAEDEETSTLKHKKKKTKKHKKHKHSSDSDSDSDRDKRSHKKNKSRRSRSSSQEIRKKSREIEKYRKRSHSRSQSPALKDSRKYRKQSHSRSRSPVCKDRRYHHREDRYRDKYRDRDSYRDRDRDSYRNSRDKGSRDYRDSDRRKERR